MQKKDIDTPKMYTRWHILFKNRRFWKIVVHYSVCLGLKSNTNTNAVLPFDLVHDKIQMAMRV